MRLLAIAATGALVVIHWDDRGTWFWVGSVLLLANLVGLAAHLRARSVR